VPSPSSEFHQRENRPDETSSPDYRTCQGQRITRPTRRLCFYPFSTARSFLRHRHPPPPLTVESPRSAVFDTNDQVLASTKTCVLRPYSKPVFALHVGMLWPTIRSSPTRHDRIPARGKAHPKALSRTIGLLRVSRTTNRSRLEKSSDSPHRTPPTEGRYC
jgi:hypothetical protein